MFLNSDKHGKNLKSDAAQLLAQLNQEGGKADISKAGDAIMLDKQYDALPPSEVANLFGDKFAKTLGGLPLAQWQGPVESAYGVHLVFVSERSVDEYPRWRTCATPCAVSGKKPIGWKRKISSTGNCSSNTG